MIAGQCISASGHISISWDSPTDGFRIEVVRASGPVQKLAWRGEYGRAFDHALAASVYFNLPLRDLTGGGE